MKLGCGPVHEHWPPTLNPTQGGGELLHWVKMGGFLILQDLLTTAVLEMVNCPAPEETSFYPKVYTLAPNIPLYNQDIYIS